MESDKTPGTAGMSGGRVLQGGRPEGADPLVVGHHPLDVTDMCIRVIPELVAAYLLCDVVQYSPKRRPDLPLAVPAVHDDQIKQLRVHVSARASGVAADVDVQRAVLGVVNHQYGRPFSDRREIFEGPSLADGISTAEGLEQPPRSLPLVPSARKGLECGPTGPGSPRGDHSAACGAEAEAGQQFAT